MGLFFLSCLCLAYFNLGHTWTLPPCFDDYPGCCPTNKSARIYCPGEEDSCQNDGKDIFNYRGDCYWDCACSEGYKFDEIKYDCVLPQDCSPKKCTKEFEWYNTCWTNCSATCQKRKVASCPIRCIAQCDCTQGYLRDEVSGNCVPETECPKEKQLTQIEINSLHEVECKKENEFFNTCAWNCTDTCQTKRSGKVPCELKCSSRCDCKVGTLRDEVTGNCVLPSQCPKAPEITKPPVTTEKNPPTDEYETTDTPSTIETTTDYWYWEVYYMTHCRGHYESLGSCVTNCDDTCQTRFNKSANFCNNKCLSDCGCQTGSLRNEITGYCVPANKCTKACPPNSHFEKSGPGCENTCTQMAGPLCPNVGIEDCFCNPGYVKNNTECVPLSECPIYNVAYSSIVENTTTEEPFETTCN